MWTKAFWKGLGERAIKTFFQTFGATLIVSAGADAIPATGIEGIPWIAVLSVSGLATILSVATSIGNADFTAGQPTQPAVVALYEATPTEGVIPVLPGESRDDYRARTGREFPE